MVLLKINGDRFLLSFYVLGITTVLNENNVGNYFCKITNPGRAGRASQPVTSDPCRQQSESEGNNLPPKRSGLGITAITSQAKRKRT